MDKPTVLEIKLLQKSRQLSVKFADGQSFDLPCEYLRVFSPSAEVQGHGLDEPLLVSGKENVNIIGIDPVGHYAVKLIFDDGHDSGIYSWDVLYRLGTEYEANWQRYLSRLQQSGVAHGS